MAEVSMKLVKELRDMTGIGMKACHKALEEANGDIELAVTNLRKSGMAAAVKKQDRETNEGIIVFAENEDRVAIVIVNAETDFVVKNEKFIAFANEIAKEVADTNPSSLESFLEQKFSKDPKITIEEHRAIIVQTIGENIQIRHFVVIEKNPQKSIGIYSHLGGKIVVAVEIEGANTEKPLAKDIAMHITASDPLFLSREKVPEDEILKEKEIAKTQMIGKPENVVNKIIEGKLQAFYEKNCLSEQPFIRDEEKSVSEIVAQRAKEINKDLVVTNFIRLSIK